MRRGALRFRSVLLLAGVMAWGCTARPERDMDPKSLESKYGLTGAYVDKISTQEGTVDATIVPTTLEDGRVVQLVIPHKRLDSDHEVFMRQGATVTPVAIADPSQKREEFVKTAPRVVERPGASWPSKTHASNKRSTKEELLIVGGEAGAGAAIGAVAHGRPDSADGEFSGGLAGLVYDLAVRNREDDRNR